MYVDQTHVHSNGVCDPNSTQCSAKISRAFECSAFITFHIA